MMVNSGLRKKLDVESGKLRDEVYVQMKMGIFTTELAKVAKTVLAYVDLAEYAEFRNSAKLKKALQYVRLALIGLQKKRFAYEQRDRLFVRFEKLLVRRGVPVDEQESLKLEFYSCRDSEQLKKWYAAWEDGGAKAKAKAAHKSLVENLRGTNELVLAQPAKVLSAREIRLANLESRASKVRQPHARRAYEEALKTKSPHAQIRLYKAALRIDGQ